MRLSFLILPFVLTLQSFGIDRVCQLRFAALSEDFGVEQVVEAYGAFLNEVAVEEGSLAVYDDLLKSADPLAVPKTKLKSDSLATFLSELRKIVDSTAIPKEELKTALQTHLSKVIEANRGTENRIQKEEVKTLNSSVLVLGDTSFIRDGISPHWSEPSGLAPGKPTGIAIANNMLFVLDKAYRRVMVWRTFPEKSNTPADFVLGQDSLNSFSQSRKDGFDEPLGIASNGSVLVVADHRKHELKIWNSLPTQNDQKPDLVLTNIGPPLAQFSPSTLFHPKGIFMDPKGRLLVCDSVNGRLLIWNQIPPQDGTPPDRVLGLPFDSRGGKVSTDPRALYYPNSVWSDGEKIIVSSNKYLLNIWNQTPSSNFVAPDLRIAASLILPKLRLDPSSDLVGTSLSHQNNRIYLSIPYHHLIYVWKNLPTSAQELPQQEINKQMMGNFEPEFVLEHEDRIGIADGRGSRIIFRAP